MKVIRTSNFGFSGERPGEDEEVVAGPGLTAMEAQRTTNRLNADEPVDSRDFYRAVADDYKLAVFEI